VNNFEYIVSQFGPRANKQFSRSITLDVDELPGSGWKLLARRQWRTGAKGRPHNDVTHRARKVATFSTWKSFEQTESRRWVWIEVIPVRDSSDAVELIPNLRSILVANSRPEARLISEERTRPTDLVLDSETWTFEQLTEGPQGKGSMRLIGSHVDNVVYMVACSAFEPGWTWPEVAQIAALEASKISAELKPE
jgi:hypothetical protein